MQTLATIFNSSLLCAEPEYLAGQGKILFSKRIMLLFFKKESIRNTNKVNFDHSSSAMTKVGDMEEKVKHFVDNE